MKMNGETTLSTVPRPGRSLPPSRKDIGSRVDWEVIRRKVLDSSARLAWVDDVPQEILEQTWARRAAQIAQAIKEDEAGEIIQIVLIRLGCELYGLEASYVFDIRPLEKVTRVPRVPGWVVGVVNLRGRIISVIDLPGFMGFSSAEREGNHNPTMQYLIVVETPCMDVALAADEVLAIETLPVSRIQEATSAVQGIQPEYMRGIVVRTQADIDQEKMNRNGKGETNPSIDNPNAANSFTGIEAGILLILDLPALLADKRLILHEDII